MRPIRESLLWVHGLVDKYWQNVGRDSVFLLLYELNPNLVERELLIPKLNKFFKKIGVQRKVGITHLLKFLQSEFDTMRIGGGRIAATFGVSGPNYISVIDFTMRHLTEFADEDRPSRNKVKVEQFTNKYGDKDTLQEFDLSGLTYRSPMLRDLSNLEGHFSISYLEGALSTKKALEAKHKRSNQSLDELLSS